jgi:hypothetical protein
MIRPISTSDLYKIADYLIGTKKNPRVALSELGFDPQHYSMREIKQWLCEIGVVYNNTWRVVE